MTAKKLNIILGVILSLLFLALIGFAFNNRSLRHDLGTTSGQLRRANKQIDLERDSIHELEARIDVLKMSMAHKVIELRDSLKQKSEESTKWQKQYAREKRYRVPVDISDAGLDSLVSGFLESQH